MKIHSLPWVFTSILTVGCGTLEPMTSQEPAATATRGEFVVIAHRGASGYLPEHTLEGAAMAHAMGVDYIDLIQAHDMEFGDPEQIIAETIPAFEKAREMGKVRYIGITCLPLSLLRRATMSISRTQMRSRALVRRASQQAMRSPLAAVIKAGIRKVCVPSVPETKRSRLSVIHGSCAGLRPAAITIRQASTPSFVLDLRIDCIVACSCVDG